MATLKTEISEIITGLGMLPYEQLPDALSAAPPQLINVTAERWTGLQNAYADGAHATSFSTSWTNGRAFLEAADGLRGRIPRRVEWKGEHRPPDYDLLPADLRVDYVFLVSCKYVSKVLMNPSPTHLFDRALGHRRAEQSLDWYEVIAPDAYEHFYRRVREVTGLDLPTDLVDLTKSDRDAIKVACRRKWPPALVEPYEEFSSAVAHATARRWLSAIPSLQDREILLWRMLRLYSSPYFLLGATKSGEPVRLRIATPWDWRQAFVLRKFDVFPQASGQPQVGWSAAIEAKADGTHRVIDGHVEVRWSHGRFCGVPEAKVYLDTPHEEVPGYFRLE